MKKSPMILLSVFMILFCVSGCSTTGSKEMEGSTTGKGNTEVENSVSTVNKSEMFTDRDWEIGYDEETSVKIILSGDSASSNSDAVEISDHRVTITEEGTYILSGTLEDGMIVVNAGDTDKVRLVLDGVQITSSTSAAIYVLEADKVFLTTASGSENTLANAGEYVAIDDNNIDAVVFSKSDLTLNGSGTLMISAAAGHGIVSKDDLALTGGTYDIKAASHGISGKDSIRIASGTYTITSGKDGIHTENTDDASKGFLYIAGGSYDITADGDGLSASAYLQMEDGDFTIHTGEGSASVTMTTDHIGFGPGGGDGFWEEYATTEVSESPSQKGIKSDGTIAIMNGSFVTDTVDDSIHAGGNIVITDGQFDLKSGDDAIHSDAHITIQNGNFTIDYCYEGIEGISITVVDGNFDITSVDDGFNAAGGSDSSGFGGGRPGQDQFSAESDIFITVHGGKFVITSKGDCMDSNGNLSIYGGTLNLTCNGSGNTALDCDGTYTNNGGDVTTNDGSENNPGQMGGAGGMGGKGEMGGGALPPSRK